MKPIIGITVESTFEPDDARSRGSLRLNYNYAEEVAKAGGVPILIPPTADAASVVELLDGWLIPGGADIDAKHWGEENHPSVELGDGTRFTIEERLFAAAPGDMPILGICYGCQFVNVALGGTLEQHVPDRTETNDHSGGTMQSYAIDAGSTLANIVGTEPIEGKSYHHQAVGRVGDGLRVVGHHDDGTVEAIESTTDRWIVGVQWHPERTPDSQATQKLMTEFIRQATIYKERRAKVTV
jgi:putative glutamine amidotransferase